MRSSPVKLLLAALLVSCVGLATYATSSARAVAVTGEGPALTSMGPLTFGPDGTLFAADNQAAAIYALELGDQADGAARGAQALDAIDQKLAAMLGTAASEISVTDLAVHPRTQNAYISVMRGQGAGAAPALFRVDGDGKIQMVSLERLTFQKVELPNAPAANPGARNNPRASAITDIAFADGKLWVAGLSNEEFASKLRAIPYPFSSVDEGTSVEIYHGNHRALETRSPVLAFLPHTLDGKLHLIAGYLCTPLVKFPVDSLTPGEKVRGITVAELGNRNRPLDMILYEKDGKQFLLMSNDQRGVMKIAAADVAMAEPITTPVETETGGVSFEPISSMQGIQQLDRLNDRSSIVIARAGDALNLQVLPLP
jgi:hypothetical protein